MILPAEIRVSVVICTCNRGAMLRQTVEAVLAQAAPYPNARLLIVDNASTDNTPGLLAELVRDQETVRVVREPRAGLYFARRRAILETPDADYLLWIDDDVIPGPNWLAGLTAELLADPALGVVGAAIDGLWDGDKPAWFTPHMQRDVPVLSFPDGKRDWGYPNYPPGASLACRRDPCLDFYCGQDRLEHPLGVQFGRPLDETVFGEDHDLSETYLRAGYRVISIDHVRVGHRILPYKLTPEWLVAKYHADGRLRVRFARLTGRPVWNRATAKLLLALPLVAVAQSLRPWLGTSSSAQWRAYLGKSVGAWRELLFGPRVTPYRYPAARTVRR
jgi:glycosyltransferase involved in cell wall biosynthesis